MAGQSEPLADFTCNMERQSFIYIQFEARRFYSRRSVVTNTAVTVESRPSHASTLTFNKTNQPLEGTKPVIIGNHGAQHIHAHIAYLFIWKRATCNPKVLSSSILSLKKVTFAVCLPAHTHIHERRIVCLQPSAKPLQCRDCTCVTENGASLPGTSIKTRFSWREMDHFSNRLRLS